MLRFSLSSLALIMLQPLTVYAEPCQTDACDLRITVNPSKRELIAIRRGHAAIRMPILTPRTIKGFSGNPSGFNAQYWFKMYPAKESVTLIVLDRQTSIAGVETDQNDAIDNPNKFSEHLIRLKRFDAEALLDSIKEVGRENTWVEIPNTRNEPIKQNSNTERKI